MPWQAVVIDLYCERLGPEFWAEPINALTNLSFIIAALVLGYQAWRRRLLTPAIQLLLLLTLAIGLGSGLFHTFATGWAQVADIVPILLLQLAFLWIYGRTMMRVSVTALVAASILFLTAAFLGRQFPQLLNGSLIYAPALLLLTGLGIYHYRHAGNRRSVLLVASGVFLLSLLFRTIDLAVCVVLPLGTHFLWHLLNGLVVYLAVYSLLMNLPPSQRGPAA